MNFKQWLKKNYQVGAIAAMTVDRVIGKNNSLPWNIPSEMQYFKNTTENTCVLMGRKTYESIGKPLKDRMNIVLSKTMDLNTPGVFVIRCIEDLQKLDIKYKQIYICGGSEIYKQTYDLCDHLLITTIFNKYQGNCLMPIFEDRFVLDVQIFQNEEYKIERYVPK